MELQRDLLLPYIIIISVPRRFPNEVRGQIAKRCKYHCAFSTLSLISLLLIVFKLMTYRWCCFHRSVATCFSRKNA